MESGFRGMDAIVTKNGRVRRAAAHAADAFCRALFPHECAACGKEGPVLCEDHAREVMRPMRGVFVCPGCGRDSPGGMPCGSGRCGGR